MIYFRREINFQGAANFFPTNPQSLILNCTTGKKPLIFCPMINITQCKVFIILQYLQTVLLNKDHIPSSSTGIKTCYQWFVSFISVSFDIK